MQKRLSTLSTTIGQPIVDETFSVDQTLTFKGLTFERCTFDYQDQSIVTFDGCTLKGCIFIGTISTNIYEEKDGGLTVFGKSEFLDCRLSKQFNRVLIANSKVFRLTDLSSSYRLDIFASTIYDSKFKGSCDTLHLKDIYFASFSWKGSVWDKRIIQKATCTSVVFDRIKINVFYLATKCHDKSTIDLSSSKLIDDWSRLRKEYSGMRLFIILLLTLFFFLPLFTHSFFLLILSNLGSRVGVHDTIPLGESLLLGNNTGWIGFAYAVLTIALVLYNFGRFYVTMTIAKLREEESFLRDASFNLMLIHPDKYKVLLRVDRILNILFWISIGYTIIKLIESLRIEVPKF